MTKNNHGFTLIELIVTLAVFSIVVVIATPSLNMFTSNSRSASQINILSSALAYARSESVSRNTSISLCARTTNLETCSGSNNWKEGWIIFTDTNTNGALDAGETLLKVFPPIAKGSVITEITGNATSALTYLNNGFISKIKAEFKYCDARGAVAAKSLIVPKTGLVKLSTDGSDADTIPEDSTGTNLTCP